MSEPFEFFDYANIYVLSSSFFRFRFRKPPARLTALGPNRDLMSSIADCRRSSCSHSRSNKLNCLQGVLRSATPTPSKRTGWPSTHKLVSNFCASR
jgi:hypothetical protein